MPDTAQLILDRLFLLVPEFQTHWDDPGNCFREDDGSFTLHGVVAEFSGYFQENYKQLPADRLAAIGALISECVASPTEELSSAAATCFLENVVEELGAEFGQYLTGEAQDFYRHSQLRDSE